MEETNPSHQRRGIWWVHGYVIPGKHSFRFYFFFCLLVSQKKKARPQVGWPPLLVLRSATPCSLRMCLSLCVCVDSWDGLQPLHMCVWIGDGRDGEWQKSDGKGMRRPLSQGQ